MKISRMPVLTGALLGLLLLYDHHLVLASSGGIMGGSSFSDSYDSSLSSSTSDFSIGVYSTAISSPGPTKVANHVQANGDHDFMIILVIVLVLFILIICCIGDLESRILDTAQTSVLKLQVGSLGTGRSLQRDLNRIAESADTSTSKGFNYVLQESILALLRHSDYCISGYSSVDKKRSVVECEKRFNQLSNGERGKFDEETLVNVNNNRMNSATSQSSNVHRNEYIVVDIKRTLEEDVKPFNQLSNEERGKFDEEALINVNNLRKKSATSHSSNGISNEYIVVTIIVAARGVPTLPPIKSVAQLKKALQKLASIPSSNIMGAHVLWTPQKEDDSLTEQEMLEDYPLLRPL